MEGGKCQLSPSIHQSTQELIILEFENESTSHSYFEKFKELQSTLPLSKWGICIAIRFCALLEINVCSKNIQIILQRYSIYKSVPAKHIQAILPNHFFLMNTSVAIIRDTNYKQELTSHLQQHGFSTRIALQSSMIPVRTIHAMICIGCYNQCNSHNSFYSSFPRKRLSWYFLWRTTERFCKYLYESIHHNHKRYTRLESHWCDSDKIEYSMLPRLFCSPSKWDYCCCGILCSTCRFKSLLSLILIEENRYAFP